MQRKEALLLSFYIQQVDKVLLKNILLDPSYPKNIFSVQSASKNNAILNFKENVAELVDLISFQLLKKIDCIIYIIYYLKKLGKKIFQYGIKC